MSPGTWRREDAPSLGSVAPVTPPVSPPPPKSVLDTGKKLSDDNTIGQEEIQQRLAHFVDHWRELKELSGAR